MSDYVVEWSAGEALVHDPRCDAVQLARERGEPILTMISCVKPPPAEWPRHDCLEPGEPAA